jgi:hypothetical protein
MTEYQRSKLLKIGFFFKPFLVHSSGVDLAQTRLHPYEELILLNRRDESRVFLAREMAYHHVAQGRLKGEPYLVTF